VSQRAVPAPAAAIDPQLCAAYLRLVEERFGLRLSAYQARDLEAAIAAGLADAGLLDPLALYRLLASGSHPDLLEALAARLTVGETHFFRVPPQIAALRDVVLPDVVGRRAAERRLALWSAGCSTGEEAYTLAILVREWLAGADGWDVRLVGTDISRPALAVAADATYGQWSFRDTPEAIRQRYFEAQGQRWRLIDAVRRMVRFAHLNLADEPHAWTRVVGTDLDVILCRNVTIYFAAAAAQRLYAQLARLLGPGGWLVLGPSDPAPGQAAGLEPVYVPGAIPWRRPRAVAVAPAGRSVARAAPPVRQPPPPRLSGRVPLRRPVIPWSRSPERGAERPPVAAASEAAEPAGPHTEGRADGIGAAEARVQAAPMEGAAHLELGMLLLDAGATERALDSLRRAVFLDTGSALGHFSLGRAWQRLGDAGRARAAFAHARRLLASVRDDAPLAAGLQVGDVRHAVEAQLGLASRPEPDERR
jgi:chemotaxis protein methyltransferase CheR